MSKEPKMDIDVLRQMLDIPTPEADTLAPTPFALRVAEILTQALAHLRTEGVIEVEDANVDLLASEITEAALDSSSIKRLQRRLVKALIHSELVEEVYGTDEEIASALRPFLEAI